MSEPLFFKSARALTVGEIATLTGAELRAGGEIARPKRWGGYHVWAERVELWVGQPGRAHDRARWGRTLTRNGDGFAGGAWSGTRLMPYCRPQTRRLPSLHCRYALSRSTDVVGADD